MAVSRKIVRYRSKNWINGLINVIGCDTDLVNEKK